MTTTTFTESYGYRCPVELGDQHYLGGEYDEETDMCYEIYVRQGVVWVGTYCDAVGLISWFMFEDDTKDSSLDRAHRWIEDQMDPMLHEKYSAGRG